MGNNDLMQVSTLCDLSQGLQVVAGAKCSESDPIRSAEYVISFADFTCSATVWVSFLY